jgi:hypothetical protein
MLVIRKIVGWVKKEHGQGHGHTIAICVTFRGVKESR